MPSQDGCRQEVIRRAYGTGLKRFSPILEGDRAQDLVDSPARMIKNLKTMEDRKLLQGETTKKPWSDSYWPLANGGLGQRYADAGFMGMNWKEGKAYIDSFSSKELIAQGRFAELSPAEKYDNLLELTGDTLTETSWLEGQHYFERYGEVESWMGLCHGWAAAAIMMGEPKKTVQINEAVFFPSDIKGLGTYLWAKGNFGTRFIGGRCDVKNPRVDAQGRPRENECLDNNPGTWHMAVVNQIGVSKRSFVMDRARDYQVWNQPVYSYSYSYFDPKTKKPVSTLSEALQKAGAWEDERKSHRARNAAYVVGVFMKVTYITENLPSHQENQEVNSSMMGLTYDLELDENMMIVGGEWYGSGHPDFLWIPVQRSFPVTHGDDDPRSVDLAALKPEDKQTARANAEYGLPTGNVVKALFRASGAVD